MPCEMNKRKSIVGIMVDKIQTIFCVPYAQNNELYRFT